MIRAVIVMNTQGKPRLLKFYEFQVPNISSVSLIRPRNLHSDPKTNPLLDSGCFCSSVEAQPPEKQQELTRSVFAVLSGRPDNVSNFVEADAIFGPGTRLVYKHLATLYFVFVFDSCENELAMLDLIQVLVETLDRCFKNVCELDIVFNFNKMHTILDEIIFGGQVLETSSERVLKAVEEISRLEKSSSSVSFVPKSVSGRFGR
ncbi:unnamed protein product [Musa hybrid cultivar]